MVIVTESGSQYRIFNGLCKKYDTEGVMVDVFKPLTIKAIEDDASSWEDIDKSQDGPVVGKRLYIAGFESQWFTTRVVQLSP